MLTRWPRALETLVDVPDCEQRVSVEGGEAHQPRLRAAGQPLHQPQLSLPQRVGGVPDTAVNEPLRSFHNVHFYYGGWTLGQESPAHLHHSAAGCRTGPQSMESPRFVTKP